MKNKKYYPLLILGLFLLSNMQIIQIINAEEDAGIGG
jgi:hypothetical protein